MKKFMFVLAGLILSLLVIHYSPLNPLGSQYTAHPLLSLVGSLLLVCFMLKAGSWIAEKTNSNHKDSV